MVKIYIQVAKKKLQRKRENGSSGKKNGIQDEREMSEVEGRRIMYRRRMERYYQGTDESKQRKARKNETVVEIF